MSNFTICYWFHFHYHHTVMSLMSYCSNVNKCTLLRSAKEAPRKASTSTRDNHQTNDKLRNKIKAKCSNIRKKFHSFTLHWKIHTIGHWYSKMPIEQSKWVSLYFLEYHVEKNQWHTLRVEFSISRVKTKTLRASVCFQYAFHFRYITSNCNKLLVRGFDVMNFDQSISLFLF